MTRNPLMAYRGLIAAAVIFLLALGLYAFVNATGGNRTPSPAASPLPSPIISVKSADVASLQLKKGGRTLTATRQNGAWTYSVCADGAAACPPQPADAVKAGVLLDAVLELRPTVSIPGAPAG